MRENGLVARQRRRFKRTTDSEHAWPIAPNLIDQDFRAQSTDQKRGAPSRDIWLCQMHCQARDISYVWTVQGWLYLSVIIDLYSRRVVGLARLCCANRCRLRAGPPVIA